MYPDILDCRYPRWASGRLQSLNMSFRQHIGVNIGWAHINVPAKKWLYFNQFNNLSFHRVCFGFKNTHEGNVFFWTFFLESLFAFNFGYIWH